MKLILAALAVASLALTGCQADDTDTMGTDGTVTTTENDGVLGTDTDTGMDTGTGMSTGSTTMP